MYFKISVYEEQLLNKCLNRERCAQKELYDNYKDAMFTISLRITNNFDDACDSLQDAFIQIFNSLGTFNKQSTLGAWIKTIVIRAAIKKKNIVPYTESIDAIINNEPIAWPTELNAEYLEKAIKELPSGYRTIFLLIEVEGYTHKEAAELLSISIGTSKSQLFNAKKLLQKKLKSVIA